MPQHTRQHMIRILEQKETTTARELSKLLKVTPSNIRHHLSILIEQGSVKIAGYATNHTRGRPSAIYSLVQTSLKDNLDIVSDILLKKLLAELTQDSQDEAFRWLSQRLVDGVQQPSHNPTQRLYLAVQTLNNLNYQAQWEAHAETPRIMFRHCPYSAILEEHPEMCQVDTYLIEHLVGIPTELLAKRALTIDGHRQCIFRITKK